MVGFYPIKSIRPQSPRGATSVTRATVSTLTITTIPPAAVKRVSRSVAKQRLNSVPNSGSVH